MSITDKTSPSRRNGTIEHFKVSRWGEMNKRTVKQSEYSKKGIKVEMSKKDFYFWCETQKPIIFHMFSIGVKPTIDRIDSKKSYSLDNIQILSWSDNSKKQDRKLSKPIIAINDGVERYFHGVYSTECMNFFGRNRCRDIVRCLKKQPNNLGCVPKTVLGWSFKYAQG